ncbi:hypothetical protein SETIT_9G343000v2 [Setaria italica]|uniref:Uncharacterized protein n=1 Tax=Setaria italica TaxID=4555 RepID=A0A368SNP8_SETIT|nr:hypothetical protein SETIT_9G343000v2 [Setaria italica]
MALFLFLLVAFYRNLLEQLNSAGDAMAKGYCCVFIACVGSTEEVVGDDWQEHIVHDFTRRRARTPAGRGHWPLSLPSFSFSTAHLRSHPSVGAGAPQPSCRRRRPPPDLRRRGALPIQSPSTDFAPPPLLLFPSYRRSSLRAPILRSSAECEHAEPLAGMELERSTCAGAGRRELRCRPHRPCTRARAGKRRD